MICKCTCSGRIVCAFVPVSVCVRQCVLHLIHPAAVLSAADNGESKRVSVAESSYSALHHLVIT